MSPKHTGVSAREVYEEACPLREVLDRVGGTWSVQILVAAVRGPIWFTELERSIEGVSRRMLTLTLRNLERDGLLQRTVYPTVPPKVEYTAHPDSPRTAHPPRRPDHLGPNATAPTSPLPASPTTTPHRRSRLPADRRRWQSDGHRQSRALAPSAR